MVEANEPSAEKIFGVGTLVYTGRLDKIEQYLGKGIPWGKKRCLFGNPNERDIRLALLGRRKDFEERLKYSSCLAPQFNKKTQREIVGLAIDTPSLVEAYGHQLLAIGEGFKERSFRDVYYVSYDGEVSGIRVADGGEIGFLDEVRMRFRRDDQYLDNSFIKGCLVGQISGDLLKYVERYPKLPFFLASGKLIKPS